MAAILFYCFIATALVWLVFWFVVGRKLRGSSSSSSSKASIQNGTGNELEAEKPRIATRSKIDVKAHSKGVGDFYDRTNEAFVEVYGEVIQAFRTNDLSNLLNQQAKAMQLKAGMRILDAGCGVCGPALFFAKEYGVQVDAVTASKVQQKAGQDRIDASKLNEKVKVLQGDYHDLKSLYPAGQYDVVYFLESFGHSADKAAAIQSAWEMLKPGGMLFIKDLFVKEAAIEAHAPEIAKNVAKINEAYHYQVGELGPVLEAVRKQGFILSALKTIDIPLEDFENLTISNDFQELTGIHQIDDLQAYLFPVDFFELHCLKPWHDLETGKSRYFMQNLYYMQVKGRSVESL